MRPPPEIHLCEAEHLDDPRYEDGLEGADSRMLRNTVLGFVVPWLLIGLGYVAFLLLTGGSLPI